MYFNALRRAVIGVVALTAALAVMATPALAVPPPEVTVSLGDSITQAFNSGVGQPACRSGGNLNCPENSWSTGTNPAVDSQFQRIQAIDPGAVAFNYSVSGASAAGLQGQAQNAVTQDPDYATVLIGANDACRPTIGAQTPTATYRSQVEAGLDTLVAGNPDVYIQVVSIPDINRLHALFTSPPDPNALTRWSALGVCQALLANPTSGAPADVSRRAAFRAQVIAYNQVLAEVCAEYARCRFDNNAGFNTAFTAADVATVTNTEGLAAFPWTVIPVIGPGNANSTADYFHPSLQGQVKIANVSWAQTFGFDGANPPNLTCTGNVTGGTYEDVTVPDDGACVLEDVRVEHDVKVKKNAYLEIVGGSVGHDVTGDGATTVLVRGGAVIDHYLQAKGGTQQLFAFDSIVLDGKIKADGVQNAFGQVNICGMNVQKGNIEVINSGSDILVGDPITLDCAGNTVEGDLKIEKNQTDVELIARGNSVGHDMKVSDNKGPSVKAVEANSGGNKLDCKNNQPPFTASANTGWSQKKNQCAGP
jgi:lysophospholipase L1-like esterase